MLNNSYEKMKIDEIERAGVTIAHSFSKGDDSLTSTIQSLSQSNDIYVMMESKGSILLFVPDANTTLPVYKYRSETTTLKNLLLLEKTRENSTGIASYRFTATGEKYNTFAYAKLLTDQEGEEYFLYIFSPLYPVSSTISILQTQLFRVTIIALILAFALAFVISRSIARPIKKITVTAEQMGKGNYDVKFETGSFTEASNLAKTLNNAAIELGRSDSLQKDLIANVSHDLKTPLTMVKSYAEMIRDLSGDIPEKRNEHLKVIMDEADRMANLVSDMSQISQMQNAKIALNIKTFDLRKTTESILDSYKILEEQDGFNFEFTAPNECYVKGDEARIKQVVANLTGNALKYCGSNKNIEVIIKKTGKFYRFEVVDHGIGIKKEEISHIWDRYYRVSSNYSRTAKGTGLGLFIVKQILTLHNAEFGVESIEGQGSTFWFELESARKPQA